MESYRIVQVGDKFQAVLQPSDRRAGGFLMGFRTEAEAVAWLDEFQRILAGQTAHPDQPGC